jgi:hypothetical protein
MSKYDKYFVEESFDKGDFAPKIRFYAWPHFGDINYSLIWNCITGELLMEKEPHAHPFDQFLNFYGGNPMDIRDFGAEVELTIEGEKHIITKTTVVHIPKYTMHCPLYFKRVDRPIIFMNVALTPLYGPRVRPTDKTTAKK